MPIIEEEYERDPRRTMLAGILSQGLANQGPPLTPLAGGLQALQSILGGIMQRRLEGEYTDRRRARAAAEAEVIKGLPPGAGTEELAAAYARSENPDLAAEGPALLAKAIAGRRAATFSTTPYFTEGGGAVQLSSAGGARPVEGVTFAESPGQRFTAEQQAARGEEARAFQKAQQGRALGAAAQRLAIQQVGAEQRSLRSTAAQERATNALLSQAGLAQEVMKGTTALDIKSFAEGEEGAKQALTAAKNTDLALSYLDRKDKEGKPYIGPGAKTRLDLDNAITSARNLITMSGGQPERIDRAAATEVLDQVLKTAGFAGAKPIFGGGAGFTQKDMEMALKLAGTIDTNPAALRQILELSKQKNAEVVQYHNAAIDAFQEQTQRPVLERHRLKLPSVRGVPVGGMAGQRRAPATKAEFDALPSGTTWVDDQGKQWTKP
ncbi:MAG: hypothetical protein ACRDIC_19690 [bacterium]